MNLPFNVTNTSLTKFDFSIKTVVSIKHTASESHLHCKNHCFASLIINAQDFIPFYQHNSTACLMVDRDKLPLCLCFSSNTSNQQPKIYLQYPRIQIFGRSCRCPLDWRFFEPQKARKAPRMPLSTDPQSEREKIPVPMHFSSVV